MKTTATVETIQADVRVLMAGSRQVTLSVFRQLDIYKYIDIVPMGRVNDKGSWIVGALRGGPHHGSLVRARSDWADVVGEMQRQNTFNLSVWRCGPSPGLSKRLAALVGDHWESGWPDIEGIMRPAMEAFDLLPLLVLAGLK